MVTVADLRALDPMVWLTAGEEWELLGDKAAAQALAIRDEVAKPLLAAWPDAVGQRAGSLIIAEASGTQIASMVCSAAAFACKALSHLLSMA
jgi:hypothetical protein